jgi:secondary thiamine-phosphate synthase enzyme
MVKQIEFSLPPLKRGIHLISEKIMVKLPVLPKSGLLHVFLKHTSAAISINENADPSVRDDMHISIENMIPENQAHFTHLDEGPDDMPGHIKLALIGNEVTVPITNHKLNLGTWQGFYFHEFRNNPAPRKLVITIMS